MVRHFIAFNAHALNLNLYSVAFVSFAETNLIASEPGTIEVVIILIGNVTFDVTVTVEFSSENSTAIGKATSIF
jgi:hypothetical protein